MAFSPALAAKLSIAALASVRRFPFLADSNTPFPLFITFLAALTDACATPAAFDAVSDIPSLTAVPTISPFEAQFAFAAFTALTVVEPPFNCVFN